MSKKIPKYKRPKPNKYEDSDVYVCARWLALIRATNCIFDRADRLGINEDSVDLSPNDIQDYIDDVSGDIYFDIVNANGATDMRKYAEKLKFK
jgi:glutathionyl-hydroquinone reductase